MANPCEQHPAKTVNNAWQKLTDKERDELSTAYQRAFLEEKDARLSTNEAISRLRKAEKALAQASRNIAEASQGKFQL